MNLLLVGIEILASKLINAVVDSVTNTSNNQPSPPSDSNENFDEILNNEISQDNSCFQTKADLPTTNYSINNENQKTINNKNQCFQDKEKQTSTSLTNKIKEKLDEKIKIQNKKVNSKNKNSLEKNEKIAKQLLNDIEKNHAIYPESILKAKLKNLIKKLNELKSIKDPQLKKFKELISKNPDIFKFDSKIKEIKIEAKVKKNDIVEKLLNENEKLKKDKIKEKNKQILSFNQEKILSKNPKKLSEISKEKLPEIKIEHHNVQKNSNKIISLKIENNYHKNKNIKNKTHLKILSKTKNNHKSNEFSKIETKLSKNENINNSTKISENTNLDTKENEKILSKNNLKEINIQKIKIKTSKTKEQIIIPKDKFNLKSNNESNKDKPSIRIKNNDKFINKIEIALNKKENLKSATKDHKKDFSNFFDRNQKVNFNYLKTSTKSVPMNNIKFSRIIEAKNLIEQIKNALKPPIKNEITIQLQPENLGKLKIHLMLQNGTLKAKITAQHNEVQNTLLNNLHHLEIALKEKGINLSNFDVTVENQNNFNKNMANNQNQNFNDSMNNNHNNFKYSFYRNFENSDDLIEENIFFSNEYYENSNLNLKI